MLVFVLWCSLALPSQAWADGENYYVVVNAKSSLKEIPEQQLKRIFLGRQLYMDDDSRVRAFLPSVEQQSYKAFLKDHIGMVPSRYQAHWRRILFSGRGVPPTNLAADEDIIRRVSSNQGGIGIVSSKSDNPKVRFIEIKM